MLSGGGGGCVLWVMAGNGVRGRSGGRGLCMMVVSDESCSGSANYSGSRK